MGYVAKYSGNYVKFLRGTPEAWNSIETKDSDTLYFIANQGENKGKLYLGSKLIADGDAATLLKNLEDVFLQDGLPSNSLLVYDGQKWVGQSLEYVLSVVVKVMTGATAEKNGTAGLVPTPKAGEQDLFLKGDGTWANPTVGVEQGLITLDEKVNKHVNDVQLEFNALRGGKTGSIVDITTDLVDTAVANLVAQAPESFDTLKEIADWITQHDSAINIADIVVKVSNHEQILNTPDTGLVSVVGSLDRLINDPITGLVPVVNAARIDIVSLQGQMSGVQSNITSINTSIDELKMMLQWQDLVEEGFEV